MSGWPSPSDCDQLARFYAALWPDSTTEEHAQEIRQVLAGKPPGIMPLIILLGETGDGAPAGFLELSLRSHVDGCDPSRPVAYVEGWFVADDHRRQGLGAKLLAVAEQWARAWGCVEMGSDTWIDNELSQRAHEALEFKVVVRCVHYRKRL